MTSFSLKGKVALVTGAAYGIGFAIAEAFAEAGARIAFNCRSQEHLDRALADYKAAGIDARGFICDVTDEVQVQSMVARIEAELGTIDILVNNAGIIKRIPMTEMSAEEFRQVVDIDLNAPFIVSKAVIPGMIAKGGGKIINICSMMSEFGRETVSAYAAAKGGLKMLTRNIPRNTANTTSSATASVQDTSLPHRPHRCVKGRPTAAGIPSTRSSWQRPRRNAGGRRRTSKVPPCSWLHRLPTSSTATSCTLTAAYSHI